MQASSPNFTSSNTLKYPVPKYNVFTLECGGKVMVVAIPSEHVNASDTGFMPTVVAIEIIAGIKIVVRTVLLVKIKCEKTVMKIKMTATAAWFNLSKPMAFTKFVIIHSAPPVLSNAFPTAYAPAEKIIKSHLIFACFHVKTPIPGSKQSNILNTAVCSVEIENPRYFFWMSPVAHKIKVIRKMIPTRFSSGDVGPKSANCFFNVSLTFAIASSPASLPTLYNFTPIKKIITAVKMACGIETINQSM